MAMFTLDVNGNKVDLATNKLQFGTPNYLPVSDLKIHCARATTSDASKNAIAFDYEDMTQDSGDAFVTPCYLAINNYYSVSAGMILYSFTMKLTHRSGVSSHDDQ